MSRRCYFDSSAVLKLLLDEPERSHVIQWVDDAQIEAVSSRLLETEIRRTALRESIPQEAATLVLDQFALFDLESWDFKAAGLLPEPGMKSLDALHLAVALRAEADAVITYDHRMVLAAARMGLPTIEPGRE